MLTKRKSRKIDPGRHGFNPDIVVFWELEFDKNIMVPGTKFKIKNDRATYVFDCFAHNTKLDISWVDARSLDTGEFKSFRLEKIKGIVLPKKSRAKKQ